MCAHLLLQKLQDYNLLLNNCQQENVGSKERPKQDGRRGEITFRIKPHNRQRCSEGSNKPSAHKDPETPQRLSQNCIGVSPQGQQWPATGARTLGAADLGMA